MIPRIDGIRGPKMKSEMRVRILIAVAALTTTTLAAADSSDHSANYFLPACQDFVNKQYSKEPFLQGQCIGMIEALATFAVNLPFKTSQSCPPENATIGQLTAVVARWLEQHPDRWHQNFTALALFALHDAWPCPEEPWHEPRR